jgi:hypothetical protein
VGHIRQTASTIRRQHGQGTVEYLGLLLAVAALLLAVMTQLKGGAGVAREIANGFTAAVRSVVGHH